MTAVPQCHAIAFPGLSVLHFISVSRLFTGGPVPYFFIPTDYKSQLELQTTMPAMAVVYPMMVVMLLCVASSYSRSQTPETELNAGCSQTQLIRCIGPVIGFVMSPDGQRMSKLRKNGQIMEEDYNKVCRLGQTTVGCLAEWSTKCIPADKTDLHIIAKGTVDIVSFCNETGSFDKFKKLTSCAQKMNETHKTCGESMKSGMQPVTFDHETPKAILGRENIQRDLCCGIKRYNSCFNKPELGSTCGNEAKVLTDKFVHRVFQAYKCTDSVFAQCPIVAV